jgi:hypothetical protein
LQQCLRGSYIIPRGIQNRKRDLIEFVLTQTSPSFVNNVLDIVKQKKHNISNEESNHIQQHKRKRMNEPFLRQIGAKLDEDVKQDDTNHKRFMDLPDPDCSKECYRQFFKATGNDAVKLDICGVCAQEVMVAENHITVKEMNNIPNSHQLIPETPHMDHTLYDGKLLEPQGVSQDEKGVVMVKICKTCLGQLQQAKDLPPRLSLANGMWIGPTPQQLRAFTFPEQMIIALLYPCVYVFKLYTKTIGHQPDPSMLQSAI